MTRPGSALTLLSLVIAIGLAIGPGRAFAQAAAAIRRPIERPTPALPLLPDFDGNLPGSAQDQSHPNYPTWQFLAGEQAVRQGDPHLALAHFGRLIRWAAANPYGDGRDGSAVTTAAIWRALTLAASLNPMNPGDAAEADGVLQVLPELRKAPLIAGMTAPSIAGSLARMEQEILRHGTILAWRLGRRDLAQDLLLDRLPAGCLSPLDAAEQEVLAAALASGKLTPERRDLINGLCYRQNGQPAQALPMLQSAAAGVDLQTALEARLDLAALNTASIRTQTDFDAVAAELNAIVQLSKDPVLAQKALYRRAFLHLRQGPWNSRARFQAELAELAERYPTGTLADDALYRLALDREDAGESDEALAAYQRLRDFSGTNDWLNLAHFKPAMLLIRLGGETNLQAASDLLRQLETRLPDGPLHPAARFWIGRIAEQLGNAPTAEASFRQVAAESPFDYYGIRAAMHLAAGPAATAMERPPQALEEAWRRLATANPPAARLSASSPYHRRLQAAVSSGLYAHLLGAAHRLAQAHPDTRLEQWLPDQLDSLGYLDAMVLLTAYRIDVQAAKDQPATPENRLELAAVIGFQAGDWAPAMRLVTGHDDPPALRHAAQRDPHFPATAYPPVFREPLLAAGAAHQVAPELLYAVMRNESLFNPDALSPRQALGLFQFIPDTFRTLDQRWHLLAQSGRSSREAYLRDPAGSIELGARWFKDELLKRNDGQELFAIMEHNAGYPAVRKWKADWQRQNRIQDLEYVLETVPFNETRLFAKRVWSDRVIAAALFEKRMSNIE